MQPSQASLPAAPNMARRIRQFYQLTKPRVVQLVVFCAVIGMLLSKRSWPDPGVLVAATLGIWLVAGAAAAFNCLVEQRIDMLMQRTAWRPSATGELTAKQIIICSGLLCSAGLLLLLFYVNALTMWLTLATFVGYAVIYSVLLKPSTPQNIVIGGLSGAMPPALGWAAMTGEVTYQPLLLVLIIFLWTPPHFWALALYRTDEYRASGLPMLPVTHGQEFTRLHILLYTVISFVSTLLPFVVKMSGWLYLAVAISSGTVFLLYAWGLYRHYSDTLARKAFRYSIIHLTLLFAALLLDHYLIVV